MKNKLIPIIAIVAIVALTVFLASLPFSPAQAAPAAVPTPVAAPDVAGAGNVFNFQPVTAIVADTNTAGVDLLNKKTVDIEFVVDQTVVVATSEVNTTTITVQYSIGNSVWTDGVVLATANAADASGLFARVPVYGRYMRIKQDVTNANPITITLTAVGR